MSKFIIIPGSWNKKLLIPFILSLVQITLVMVNKYYERVEKNDIVLQLYSFGLAELSVRLLPLILDISNKNTEKDQNLTKRKKCCHYTLLCVFFMLSMSARSVAYGLEFNINDVVASNLAESFMFPINDFIIMSIEMLFMVGVSICLLKYKFYKHHIISIIFVTIFGIATDLSLNTYIDKNKIFWTSFFIKIFGVAADALYYSYQKYMMEILFYPYWNVALVPGIYMMVTTTFLLLYLITHEGGANSSDYFVRRFYSFFNNVSTGKIIGKIILVLILNIILCPLTILTVYYFNPTFILITIQLSLFTEILIRMQSADKLYILIFLLIQFIALLIHLEILELNFCNLNKNTKRNIEIRGDIDVLNEGRDSTFSINKIDLNKDYFVEELPNCNSYLEMNAIHGIEDQLYGESED